MADKKTDSTNTSQAGASSDPQTQESTNKQDMNTQSTGTPSPKYTDKELSEMIEKARAEEKSKVFSKLEAIKSEKDKVLSSLEELKEAKKQLEADRDALREGRASDLKSVNEELSQLREQNEKLQRAIESTVETSAQQIRAHELRAYKAEKIREAELRLTELVSGTTEEEIDLSIKTAKSREEEIAAQLREQLQKELAGNLPKPMSTDGSRGRGPTPVVTAENRQAVARLSKDEYLKRREQLLSEARIKAGLE